jgi:hypothetical protein
LRVETAGRALQEMVGEADSVRCMGYWSGTDAINFAPFDLCQQRSTVASVSMYRHSHSQIHALASLAMWMEDE